jgi:hypothetical protein
MSNHVKILKFNNIEFPSILVIKIKQTKKISQNGKTQLMASFLHSMKYQLGRLTEKE